MFVRYYVFMEQAFGEVERSILASRETGMQSAAQAVGRRNLTLAKVRVPAPGAALRKLVEMRFGEPLRQDATTTWLPFTWCATNARTLFPKFEGDIVISQLRPGTTQVAVSANYQPPFGPVGRVLDRAAMHLLAEALIKDLVDGIADAISEEPAVKANAGAA